MFVKLDVFFFFGFDVQFLVLVLINQQNDLNSLIIHAAVAIPLTVILLMFAYYGVCFLMASGIHWNRFDTRTES